MDAPGDFRPSAARTREPGDEARAVRTRRWLDPAALAEGLGWSTAAPSTPGAGSRGAAVVDLIGLIGSCRGDGASLDRTPTTAGEPGYTVRTRLDGVRALVADERRAAAVVAYEAMRVPGLLQTGDYARAITRSGGESAEPAVSARTERQEVLRGSGPPRARFFLHEAALHNGVGDRRVMAAQLLRLVLLGERDHVEIRLVPFRVGNRDWMTNPFRLVEFEDGEPVVHAAGLTFSVRSGRPDVVERHLRVIGDLHRLALDAGESRSEFVRWADHYERSRA
ncbi:DUF5753 domain-containing protein [Umezawaea sp.]|uniref:DUF5753 domain-containing protein n=1 Tax=Umezawaea sp. TaxID=1955258 RepID=UPI002ED371A9